MKKLTIMFAMLLMTVVSFAQDVVTPPASAEVMDYVMSATWSMSSKTNSFERPVKVAIDGTNVYVQGLAECLPEGWAMGTNDNGVVTFAKKQLMGTVTEGDVYFEDTDIVFNYDAEADSYTTDLMEINYGNYWEIYRDITLAKPAAVDPFTAIDITPAEGEVISIYEFTLDFTAFENVRAVWSFDIDDPYLIDVNTNETVATGYLDDDYAGTLTVNFSEFTTPGTYQLVIPAGSIEVNEVANAEDLVFNYTIPAPVVFGWTINPEEGTVESLTNVFEIQFENGKVAYDYTKADPTLTKDGESLAEFKTMSVSTSQKATLYFGSVSETTNYTEDGTYVLTIPAGTLTNNGEAMEELTFTWTIGEGGDEPGDEPVVELGDNDLVTLPEGVSAEEYQFKAVKPAYSIFPEEEITGTVQVAFDGNDVYVQGLSRENAPEAWVKGVKDGNNITFAKMQLLKSEETQTWSGSTFTTDYYFNATDDVVFAYDEANNKLTSEAGYLIHSENSNYAGEYAESETLTKVEIFKEGGDEPIVEPGDDDLVTPPATAEQKDYLFEAANAYTGAAYNRAAKVAVDGTDVYFQGLSSQLPEAWVKGVMAENNVTVAGKQLLGTYVEDNTAFGGEKKEYELYFSPEGNDVVFAYNEEDDAYTTAAYGIDVDVEDVYGKNEDYKDVKIYTEKAKTLEEVLAQKAIDPEEGEVESLQSFTITFGDAVVTVNEDAIPTLGDLDGGMAASEDGTTVMVDFDEPITEAGEYTLTIPAGAIMYNGEDMGEMTFAYTVVAPKVLSWTIDPEEAEGLESLSNHFALNFADGSVSRLNYTQDLILTFNGQTEMIQAAESEDEEDVNLLEFKSMSLNSNGTKADIYFGSMSDFTYTEEGTYVLTIPAGIFKNNATGEELAEMTFTWTIGNGEENPEEDVLVEVPAGVEQEDWHIEATYYTSQGSNDVNKNNKVAFDGDDVYIQGLAYYFPEAWVKGKMVNGQAVFASGQFVGEDDYGKEYLNGATLDESYNFIYNDTYVFDYDEEAQKFTLVETYLTECSEKDAIDAWGYYPINGLEIIKGEAELPEAVVAPENLVTEDYIFKAQEMSFDDNYQAVYEDYEAEIKIGFDGNDVYVQGLCADYYLPEAWVKGEKDGSTVTFTTGQFFGTVYGQYDMYFVGYGENSITDVVMTYNEATGEFTTDNWIFINGKQNDIYYYTIYTSNVFTKKGASSAIENVNAEESNAVYYDAMGRRTNSEAKGLLLKQVRMADGTVKTVKIARK